MYVSDVLEEGSLPEIYKETVLYFWCIMQNFHLTHFGYFILKKGVKGAQILKFLIYGRYIEF
jgi:hypothetical protein